MKVGQNPPESLSGKKLRHEKAKKGKNEQNSHFGSSCYFLFQVLQVDLCPFMCRAEAHFVSSTSNCCSFECSRKLREARFWNSPQLVGWGRVRTCHRRCGWSLWKQGAGHSAPSRRAWFDGALRRVHMATWRIRINGCVGAWRVLPRRKPRPRRHVHLCRKGHSGCHVGDHDLHCLEWRVVPRGEKHPTWVGFDEEFPTPSVRRGDARDGREDMPNELTALNRHEGPLLCPPINPLAVAVGELEESLLGPLPGGFDTRPRTEGAEARTVCLIRPGLPVRDVEVTPRIGKRCSRSPSRRRSSSQRHDQRKSDCRLRRRLASVVKEYQGIREELGCGQSARHKMLMTVAERTMQQVVLLEARKSKRSRKHNKKSTRKRRTASSSASWAGSGVTSDTESEDLGLEPSSGVMEVSKQYSGGLLRSFLRTIGSQVVTTGDTQGALGEVRLLELVPDLATKYLDKITTRRSFAVSTSAEMRVLAEVMDSLLAMWGARATSWPRGS